MKTVTYFQCEVCNAEYLDENLARQCEAIPTPELPVIGSRCLAPESYHNVETVIIDAWIGNGSKYQPGLVQPGHRVMVEVEEPLYQQPDNDDQYESVFDLTSVKILPDDGRISRGLDDDEEEVDDDTEDC